MKKLWTVGAAIIVAAFFIQSCGGGAEQETSAPPLKLQSSQPAMNEPEDDGIGVGPVTEIVLADALDQGLVEEGKRLFEGMCVACHTMDTRLVGPPMKGITERRKPEWIMNMIINPDVMVKEDPTAKALLAEYKAPMANQNITEEQARAMLEYFRMYDQQ